MPLYTPELGGSEIELHQMAEILTLSVAEFAAHARSLAISDELLCPDAAASITGADILIDGGWCAR